MNRHLDDAVASPARQIEQLDVEGEVLERLGGEEILRGGAREALEATLGVVDARQQRWRAQEIEGPPDDVAQHRLVVAHGAGCHAAADGDVDAL
jgi:hypothetical protein